MNFFLRDISASSRLCVKLLFFASYHLLFATCDLTLALLFIFFLFVIFLLHGYLVYNSSRNELALLEHEWSSLSACVVLRLSSHDLHLWRHFDFHTVAT